MSPQERTRQAIRDVGLGVATAGLVVILTFWGSLAAVQGAYVLMTLALLIWTASTDLSRLQGKTGWPRPLIFAGLSVLIAVNASMFSFTGFGALLLSTGVLVVAALIGLTRVLRHVGE